MTEDKERVSWSAEEAAHHKVLRDTIASTNNEKIRFAEVVDRNKKAEAEIMASGEFLELKKIKTGRETARLDLEIEEKRKEKVVSEVEAHDAKAIASSLGTKASSLKKEVTRIESSVKENQASLDSILGEIIEKESDLASFNPRIKAGENALSDLVVSVVVEEDRLADLKKEQKAIEASNKKSLANNAINNANIIKTRDLLLEEIDILDIKKVELVTYLSIEGEKKVPIEKEILALNEKRNEAAGSLEETLKGIAKKTEGASALLIALNNKTIGLKKKEIELVRLYKQIGLSVTWSDVK